MKKPLLIIAVLFPIMALACKTGEKEDKAVRRVITFENTPSVRPYSPAIEADDMLFVSGQIAVNQATGKLIEGGIEEQTRQALNNLKSIIEKGGYKMENVVKCTVLLQDISFYAMMNQIYMEYFKLDPPARMAFAVKDLPMGALIEIDAIAVK
jgi:2-iminobutanoate/2-iminopropanoate deaminase